MSFQKFKSDSHCIGGRHHSATVKNYGDITSRGSKVIIGYCSICNRKKSILFLIILLKQKDFLVFSKIWERSLLKQAKN